MSKFGVLFAVRATTDIFEEMRKVREIGCECCQITMWNPAMYTDEVAEKLMTASKEYGIEISTLWAGWTGPTAWNFTEGPMVLGIVPAAYRMQRMQELMQAAEFAEKIGVSRIATHVGFLPENMNDPQYFDILAALKQIVAKCRAHNVNVLFETGQETPTTLLRTREDVGLDNLGINLDPANFILYGKANPVDALDTIGKYVRDVHAKDGLYPTNGRELGAEVALGKGKVNFPMLIAGLNALGYDGPITIEREIDGEQQLADIASGKAFLEKLI